MWVYSTARSFTEKLWWLYRRTDRPGFACSKPIPKLRFDSWLMRNNRSRQCLLSLFVSMFLCTAFFSMALSDLRPFLPGNPQSFRLPCFHSTRSSCTNLMRRISLHMIMC